MKIIGITGGIGAGKSTVCSEFVKYGVKVVDADAISRCITLKNGKAYPEIVEYFGNSILKEDGEIDRKRLSDIVFSDKDKLEMLNKMTHKHIFEKMREEINSSNTDIVVLDVPLLFSSDFDIECDLKIAVIADMKERINRVIIRDNTNKDDVLRRIKVQIPDERMKELADICIENDSFESMRGQVKKIIEMLRS